MTDGLQSLFTPASVAVVGASDDPAKWGHWLALRALRGEHRRAVHLVNHRAETVLGRPVLRSLRELSEPVELVVVSVPEPALDATVDDALAAGARAIVAISAGTTGTGREAELAARVRAGGARLVGPNCLGLFDAEAELELVSNDLPPGSVGLISQSGNLALELGAMAAGAGLGFSRFVSIGNQADVSAAELVTAMAAHPGTRAIALYIEDFRDGRAFARAAARAVDGGTPVALLTVPRVGATTRAIRSHTGAMASDAAAVGAACAAAGIEPVRSPRELIDVVAALVRCRPLRGPRVGVMGDGGGHGIIAAALAAEAGLDVPELTETTQARLRAPLPPAASVANPVDLAGGGEADLGNFVHVAGTLAASGEVDAVLLTGYFGGYAEYGEALAARELATAHALARLPAETEVALVAHTMFPAGAAADALRADGVPVYGAVEHAAEALRRLARAGRHTGSIPALPAAAAPITDSGYVAARALLAAAGIPFAAQATVSSAAQARRAADRIGYPVVLKALGRLHKSDAGGVALGLADAGALTAALEAMTHRLGAKTFSVEAQADTAAGVELLIGSRRDHRFGPLALVALGGVHAEILDDTAVALAPVDVAEAEAMIGRLRAAPLLTGARGRPCLDRAAAAHALAALSRVAAAHPEIAELEINPLLVAPEGVLGLDARIVIE
ncbi:MAG TPA: acetate--CoA ligase family protein [Solirubrobacteraceae bacterium]|nr:acetate--CoA ligase family protein [Solirubrobacteraceae bacterium]